MSRSEPNKTQNPAQRFFKWSGKKGQLEFYDKELKDNVTVPLPFTFLFLDRLSTIGGFCKADKSGYWANEVRDTRSEPLTVRTSAGIKQTGLYQDVKALHGAKFAQSIYIAFYDDAKQLQIGNIKLTGCGNSAWIDFSKSKDLDRQPGAIVLKGRGELETNGDTEYYPPIFEQKLNVSEETNAKAVELDRELQTYLRAYFALKGEERASAASASGHSMDYSGEEYPPTSVDAPPPLVEPSGPDFGDDIPF